MYNLVTPTICLHSSTIEYAGVWRWKDIMDCSYLVDLLAIWLVDITHNALYSRLKSCVPLVHFTSLVLFLMNNLRFHSHHTHLSWPGHTLARRDITPFLQDQYIYLSHILESAISFPCLYIYTWHPIVVECIPCYSECYLTGISSIGLYCHMSRPAFGVVCMYNVHLTILTRSIALYETKTTKIGYATRVMNQCLPLIWCNHGE